MNTKMVLISVIVPVYNVEKYIEKCILSIINQTYKNLQVILVDDGSMDSSGEICDVYAQKDQRIQVVHQKNGGLVCARKKGLEEAKGEYIGFVDGDDYIDENMYMEMLQDILNFKVDFIQIGEFYEKNGVVNLRMDYEEGIYNITNTRTQFMRDYIMEACANKNMSYSMCSKLFKQELIKKCYQRVPNSQSYGEDLIALCACLLESKFIYMKKKAFYHYVYRNDSITNSDLIRRIVNLGDLYKCIKKLLRQYNCYDTLNDALDIWFQKKIINNVYAMSNSYFYMQRYFYPNIQSLFGKKIALYGAGEVGKDIYAQIRRYEQCEIVVWIDQNASKLKYDYATIKDKDELHKYNYDICIIAVKNCDVASQIKYELIKCGIEEDIIIWEEPYYF